MNCARIMIKPKRSKISINFKRQKKKTVKIFKREI